MARQNTKHRQFGEHLNRIQTVDLWDLQSMAQQNTETSAVWRTLVEYRWYISETYHKQHSKSMNHRQFGRILRVVEIQMIHLWDLAPMAQQNTETSAVWWTFKQNTDSTSLRLSTVVWWTLRVIRTLMVRLWDPAPIARQKSETSAVLWTFRVARIQMVHLWDLASIAQQSIKTSAVWWTFNKRQMCICGDLPLMARLGSETSTVWWTVRLQTVAHLKPRRGKTLNIGSLVDSQGVDIQNTSSLRRTNDDKTLTLRQFGRL